MAGVYVATLPRVDEGSSCMNLKLPELSSAWSASSGYFALRFRPVVTGRVVSCRLGLSHLGKLKEEICNLNHRSSAEAGGFMSTSSSSFGFSRIWRARSSSSFPSSVEEEQLQDTFDTTPEGADAEVSRRDMLREAIIKLSQEDLEVAAKKYKLEEELFAEIDFAQINAFTDRPFSGNPAAVCYLPFEKDDQWLQLIAREFNLSETAFIIKRRKAKNTSAKEKEIGEKKLLELDDDGKSLKTVMKNKYPRDIENEFNLRWFTPKIEVNLCGHATLASAHLLFSSGIVEHDTILFHTRSGVLKARKVAGYEIDDDTQPEEESKEDFRREKRRPIGTGVVELNFPLVLADKCDDIEAKQLSEALGGVETLWVGITNLGFYLVEVSSTKDVEELEPQFQKMMDLRGIGGIIVTARAEQDSKFDFISRFFCPKAGILEDPVTGSAHCVLGPYWADKLGKNILEAFQASERGGKVSVRVEKGEGRVYLQGSAVLVMAGVLLNTMRS